MILRDYHEIGLKNEPLLSGDLTIDEYLKRVNAKGASLRRRRIGRECLRRQSTELLQNPNFSLAAGCNVHIQMSSVELFQENGIFSIILKPIDQQ